MESNKLENINVRVDQLAVKIEELVGVMRKKVATAVNSAQVYTYFEVGRYIVEDEQNGNSRAEYGKGLLKQVSYRLTEHLGKGWSEELLKNVVSFIGFFKIGIQCIPIQKI